MAERSAKISRKTSETDIELSLCLDGAGKAAVNTGIGFFDHMLTAFARHGLFDLEVICKGDLYVDGHHSVEDVGIALGQAIAKALGDKAGIRRTGSCTMPMDEALVLCAVDLSGRTYYSSDLAFTAPRIGDFDTEMAGEFFYAVANAAGMNLHFVQHRGVNNHHVAEAAFKAFARALDAATAPDARVEGVPSTKGVLC